MKTRNGFVTNSSSSSFIIKRKYLTEYQIYQISNHISCAEKIQMVEDVDFGYVGEDEAWNISENDETVEGRASMDNFDMVEFLEYIGVPGNKIKWGDGY